MLKRLFLVICLLCVPASVIADTCDYQKQINFTVSAANASSLIVDVGAGSLKISGDSTSEEVIVSATACAESRGQLDDLDLVYELEESDIVVRSIFPQRQGFLSSFRSWNALIDVEIVMPQRLNLNIDDGSGSIAVSDVGSLVLDDGSGSINISGIGGDLYVEDGSGSIQISNVRGNVTVDDGSGDIEILNSNSVRIIDDGAGSIFIQDIAGDVVIEDDGSGGIEVFKVGGNVEIADAGSGSIEVQDVAGNYIKHD